MTLSRKVLIFVYMLMRHPFLFFKYTCKKSSRLFLLNGGNQDVKTKNLIVGQNVRMGNSTRINFYGDGKLIIGDSCYIGQRNSFLCGEKISIGKEVLIASDVCITSENHSIDPTINIGYGKQKLITKPVSIGDGCWIGEKVIILPGVSIGKKSVIGAGSVVTKDIPDYCIAVGNPARIVKKYDFNKHEWMTVKNN